MAFTSALGPCRSSAEGPAVTLTVRCFKFGSSSSREPLSDCAVGELFRFRITGKDKGRDTKGMSAGSRPLAGWVMETESRSGQHCVPTVAPMQPALRRAANQPQPITAQNQHHVVRYASSAATGERRNHNDKNKSSAWCLQDKVVNATTLSFSKGNR